MTHRLRTFIVKKKGDLLLVALIAIATFLHFYDLNWGAPYYFHPDERNIASSISQMRFTDNLNPHFFAYGSFPLYTIFFSTLPLAFFTYCQQTLPCSIRFEDAIFFGRIFSASLATLLIPLLYLGGSMLFSKRGGIIAACFGTFLTGITQFAHFATFEIWSTFFSFAVFLLSLQFARRPKKYILFFLALTTGLLLSIKATNLLLFPIPLIAIAFGVFHQKKQKKITSLLHTIVSLLFVLLISLAIYLLTNPFALLDYSSFRNSLNYESSVALGSLQVFYTGEFIESIPLLFQLARVFPFLLNPLLTILFTISIPVAIYSIISKRSFQLFLLLSATLLLLLPQSFFFVKWTRYMVPTLPFAVLLITFLFEKSLKHQRFSKPSSVLLLISIGATIVFGGSYFIAAFVEKDTRVSASDYAATHLPSNAKIIADIYDMGIVTFNEHFPNISLFNYYDLDNHNPEASTAVLNQKLKATDYVVLPSQRILATRLGHPKNFPEGYAFFNRLTTDTNRFRLIYETPCSIFCKIAYLGNQTFFLEGTVNAFDRPPFRIYKVTHEQ